MFERFRGKNHLNEKGLEIEAGEWKQGQVDDAAYFRRHSARLISRVHALQAGGGRGILGGL